jgi:hypothetical protein
MGLSSMPRRLHDLPLTAGVAAIRPIARFDSELAAGATTYAGSRTLRFQWRAAALHPRHTSRKNRGHPC